MKFMSSRALDPTAAPFVPAYATWAAWTDDDPVAGPAELVFQADYGTFPLEYDLGIVVPQALHYDQLAYAQVECWTRFPSMPVATVYDSVAENLRISRERKLHHPQPERHIVISFLADD